MCTCSTQLANLRHYSPVLPFLLTIQHQHHKWNEGQQRNNSRDWAISLLLLYRLLFQQSTMLDLWPFNKKSDSIVIITLIQSVIMSFLMSKYIVYPKELTRPLDHFPPRDESVEQAFRNLWKVYWDHRTGLNATNSLGSAMCSNASSECDTDMVHSPTTAVEMEEKPIAHHVIQPTPTLDIGNHKSVEDWALITDRVVDNMMNVYESRTKRHAETVVDWNSGGEPLQLIVVEVVVEILETLEVFEINGTL